MLQPSKRDIVDLTGFMIAVMSSQLMSPLSCATYEWRPRTNTVHSSHWRNSMDSEVIVSCVNNSHVHTYLFLIF